MGSFGWHNPWPFQWGGGPTEDERIYEAMRSAVGNLAAEDDTGIDGLWRACKARMIADVSTMAERAVMQAFPFVTTDHLPLWEAYLGITPQGGATDEERRQDVAVEYTRKILADGPSVLSQLKAIDPRLSVLEIYRSKSTVTVLGKPFSSNYPNFANEFVVTVIFSLPDDPLPGPAELQVMRQVKRLLNETLPAWVDWQIVTGFGFVLDLSPLDVTGLTDS